MSSGSNLSNIIYQTNDTISWSIDRVGDPSLLINNYIYNFSPTSVTASNISGQIYDIINYDIINYDSIYLFNTPARSVPSELVLDQDIQFSEEQCECCICMDKKEGENICQFNCGHTFCVTCVDTSLKTFKDRNKDVICALCRTEVTKITFKTQENKDKIQEYV
jgi:hypothetical protein